MTDRIRTNDPARVAALRQYAAAHDHFAEQEQLAAAHDRPIEAEGYHWHALRVLRAYRAELDDPQPRVDA